MSGVSRMQPSWTASQLMEIAKWQKFVVWLVGAQIIMMIATMAMAISLGPDAKDNVIAGLFAIAVFVFRLVVVILGLYGGFKMATALSKSGILYAILMLIPLVALIALLHLSAVSTKALQENGVSVGLFGAKQSDLDRIMAQGIPEA